MEDKFLIISKEQVNALIGRLGDAEELASCIDELTRMLAIKTTLAWRADQGS